MPRNIEAKEASTIVRRLQTFDPVQVSQGMEKLKGIVELKTTDFVRRGVSYRTTVITVTDPQALKSVNFDQFVENVNPEFAKAGKLIQKFVSFEPTVISEAGNYLPAGMLKHQPGDVMVNVGFNFNCKKLSTTDHYWPSVLEAEMP